MKTPVVVKVAVVVLGLIGMYVLIGLCFATYEAVTYDPFTTSFPNNIVLFILNTFLWATF